VTSPELVRAAILTGVALVAGAVDAIGGGGGLLTLPALLWAGLPPHLALGTNKGQSVFGSGAALVRYSRAGLVDPAQARWTFPLGLLGSLGGAALVLRISPERLRPLVLALLAGAAVFVALRRAAPEAGPRRQGRARHVLAAGIAAVIGAYDGFFGPGTGTFLIVAFVALLGDGLARASAEAKVVNFASNLAAMALFSASGVVDWRVALPMAGGELAGGWLGAHLAVRRGDRLIRGVVVVIALALAARLTWQTFSR
jgi:uncharacterized membrane protein YfcA